MTQELLTHIHEIYAKPELRAAGKVAGGHLTNNYILTNAAEEKFFLKEYRFDDEDRIKQIHAVKKFFHDGGIPVIMPLTNSTGQRYFIFDEKIFAVFPFVDGENFSAHFDNDTAVTQTAEMLARIHLLSKEQCPQITAAQSFSWNQESFLRDEMHFLRLQKAHTTENPGNTLVDELYHTKKDIVAQCLHSRLDFDLPCDHVIHGDYYGENIFYDQAGNIQHVFDIEKTSRSPRAVEIVRSIELLFFDHGFSEDNFARTEKYLQAYTALYPITKKEIDDAIRVWFLHVGHSLWFERLHFLHDDEHLEKIIAKKHLVVTYYAKNLDDYIARITSYI